MIDKDLIKMAKETKSTEELISLIRDNDIKLSEEEAKEFFASLHRNGKLGDDELDTVSGGACHTTYAGKKYTVVTSACKCFTGMYERTPYTVFDDFTRANWYSYSKEGCCGYCRHLWIEKGIGFCSKSVN